MQGEGCVEGRVEFEFPGLGEGGGEWVHWENFLRSLSVGLNSEEKGRTRRPMTASYLF